MGMYSDLVEVSSGRSNKEAAAIIPKICVHNVTQSGSCRLLWLLLHMF